MESDDTSTTSVDDTFTLELAGRTIIFKRALKGQVMVLGKMADRARQKLAAIEDPQDAGELVTQLNVSMLEMVESLVVDPADVAFLERQMLLGVIDVDDLLPALSGRKAVAPAADDEPPAPRPRRVAKATKAARTPRKAAVKKR